MDQRHEFVRLALAEGAKRRELCRRFKISAQTGYKWLKRWAEGDHKLADRSRRPHGSPSRCAEGIEAQIVAVRMAHPAWGARKIKSCLERDGIAMPAFSTVHEILRRQDCVHPAQGAPFGAHIRFEKPAPNLLWQMDFKGWIALSDGTRCHPLTMIDDHSRYVPCLKACADQQRTTVQSALETTFRRYGLPHAIFVDNGSPWGDGSGRHWTRLRVWLIKLGIELIYSRPYHPQGRGKNERFHRTLNQEVLALQRFANLGAVQRAFDAWREVYNFERPHEALQQQTPASRYRISGRSMPAGLPQLRYSEHEIVRTVPRSKDYIHFKGRLWKVPEALRGERLAIRPTVDGNYGVFFASHQVSSIGLPRPDSVNHVPEQVSAMSPV